MEKISSLFFILIFVVYFILGGCTENPFFKDDKITPINRTIVGKVELSDGVCPNNVFVWLEGFDLSTRTDRGGKFQIELPQPSLQPGGGLSGVFKLYFYVANYQLKYVEIAVVNGNIEYSKAGLNDKGELNHTMILSKMLDLNASINPCSVKEDSQDSISVIITARAVEDTVWATSLFSKPSYKGDTILITGFLKKADSGEFVRTIYNKKKEYLPGFFPVSSEFPELLHLVISHQPGTLPVGEYEVVPYILIQQENIPADLIKSLGENVEDFGADFLKIPLKVRNNKLEVKP